MEFSITLISESTDRVQVQKIPYPGNNVFVGVFDDVMARILHLMHFRLRKKLLPTIQEMVVEAEILLSP